MKMRTLGVAILLLFLTPITVHADPFTEVYDKYKARQYDEAITLADNLIKSNASDNAVAGSLTFLKALSFLGKGDTEAFVKIAKEFDARFPNNRFAADMMSNLIGVSYRQGKYEDAVKTSIAYLDKYFRIHNKNRQKVDWYLVSSLVKLGKYDLVEPVVGRALKQIPKHTQRSNLLFLEAQSALGQKDYTKAYEKFEKLATADPDQGICSQSKFYVADSAFLLAEENQLKGAGLDSVNGEFKRALELLEVFKNLKHGNQELNNLMDVRMIQCYRRLHKYDTFDDTLKVALSKPELQTQKGTLLFEQAESFYERQQWGKAIDIFNALYSWARFNPANASFLSERISLTDYHRVLCIMNMGDDQAFETAAKEFIEKYPRDENALQIEFNLSLVPYNKGDWPAARKSLTTFLENHPRAKEEMISNAQYSLINCMIAANEYASARQSVQKFLAANPGASGQTRLKFLAAIVDFKDGKWSEASTGLQKLIEISPDGEVAANARLYIGIAMMYEANKMKKSGKAMSQVTELEKNGRKYLTEWMKAAKPDLQSEMDALYYQEDFNGIKEIAVKYLKSGVQSDLVKKAQMLNWMGLVLINQIPADLQGAHDYFSQAIQVSSKNHELLAAEEAKAIFWDTWITLYNNDQQNIREYITKLKALPQSSTKLMYLQKLMYL